MQSTHNECKFKDATLYPFILKMYIPDAFQEDEERFCFCGKKGAAETSNWKFICGT